MAFPLNIDPDKVMTILLGEITTALRGWLKGRPTDEVALMSRITQQLNRQRRSCDVGVNSEVTMRSQVTTLHRKGPNQTDLFGSDLAVTVDIDSAKFRKTALFQLKKCQEFETEIEVNQLRASQLNPLVAPRSFVLFADEVRTGIRIAPMSRLLAEFETTNHQSKRVNCSSWDSLIQWTMAWLSCEIGPLSNTEDFNSIESLLEKYVVQSEDWLSIGSPKKINWDTHDYLPARTWLLFRFLQTDRTEEAIPSLFDL